MKIEERYTWMDFYEELADKLLLYKNDRPKLITKIQSMYEDLDLKVPKLDSTPAPVDIDPYTVFGLFNKGISDLNRRKLVAAIAKEFEILSPIPSDFHGVPTLSPLNATFYAFVGDERRKEHDIDNLWWVFEAEIALARNDSEETRSSFIAAYDSTVGQFGLGWKLTMGLYWARPHTFISLDSRNRWYLGDMAHAGEAIAAITPKEREASKPDGKAYLAICDAIQREFGTAECPQHDFTELSDAAFDESERVNMERKLATKTAQGKTDDAALGDGGVETRRYWLYSPGAAACKWAEFYDRGVMGLGWSELGDLNSYATKEEMRTRLQECHDDGSSQKNSARACWQFVNDIKPGDIIFAKRGMSEIIGRGIVEGDYEYDPDSSDEYPNLRSVRWTHKGKWMRDKRFAQKTLTDVTDYTDMVADLQSYFVELVEEGDDVDSSIELPAYCKVDFLDEVYMDERAYDTLVGVLRAKKNIILQGAPGVGKTFVAKRLAYSVMGVKDPDRVRMVQFHQSYSYEDFIEGFRPCKEGFELDKGVFYTFCKAAQDDPEHDYFFIIDEINRGNLSKIFGELFMLIENDKRGPKNKLQLLYSREQFYVPSNVYIIGMMNTADRSLALLDYALRRRFAFFDLKPGFETEGFISYRDGLQSPKLNNLFSCIVELNKEIADDEALGEGFCIGHSYFCGMRPEDVTEGKLSAIVEFELVPLLKEYWFDEPGKVGNWTSRLRGAIK